MLQVTDSAAAVFKDILADQGIDVSAIRLTQPEDGDTTGGFEIMAVAQPGQQDVAALSDGVDVYVAPELAPELDHLVLDADRTDEGPAFFVRHQEGEDH